jgi:hypothetical protein
MTTEELEAAIREIILKDFNAIYTGNLKITELNPGFKIDFYLQDNYERPVSLIASIEDDAVLLQWLKKELRRSAWPTIKFYQVKKPYD